MHSALGVCDIHLLLRCSIDNRLTDKELEVCIFFFFLQFSILEHTAITSSTMVLVSHRAPASALVRVVQPTMHSALGVYDIYLLLAVVSCSISLSTGS